MAAFEEAESVSFPKVVLEEPEAVSLLPFLEPDLQGRLSPYAKSSISYLGDSQTCTKAPKVTVSVWAAK